MSLIVGVGPGNDSKIDEQKIKAYKLFSNKLWNIARFIFENTAGESIEHDFKAFSRADIELCNGFQAFLKEITKEMDEYKFYIVAEKIYHYVWHEFADNILEESKKIFKEGTEADKKSRRQFLLSALDNILRVSHPFMPYITEEIWSDMPGKNKSLLMVEEWPNIRQ